MNKLKLEFLNTKDYLVGGKHQSTEAITLAKAATELLSKRDKSEVDLSYKHFYTLCEFLLDDVNKGKVMVMVSWHDVDDDKNLIVKVAPNINNMNIVRKLSNEIFAYLEKELVNLDLDNVVCFARNDDKTTGIMYA